MRTPFKYQEHPIELGIKSQAIMIQAACGTGKSLMSIQIALGKGKPTLIITPKNITKDFKAELIADGVPEEDIWLYDAADSHKAGYMEQFTKWLLEGREIG